MAIVSVIEFLAIWQIRNEGSGQMLVLFDAIYHIGEIEAGANSVLQLHATSHCDDQAIEDNKADDIHSIYSTACRALPT